MTVPREPLASLPNPASDRRWHQVGLRTILLGFVVAALFFGVMRIFFYELEGVDQSYEQARQVDMVAIYLPDKATQFNYWTSPGRRLIMANFRISEQEFLAWAESQGWTLERIDELGQGRTVLHIYQCAAGRPSPTRSAIIRDGYTARRPSSEREKLDQVIAYDRVDGRAYFSQVPR